MVRERTPEELDEIYDGQKEDLAPEQVAGQLWLELQKYGLDWKQKVAVVSYLFNAVVASRHTTQ